MDREKEKDIGARRLHHAWDARWSVEVRMDATIFKRDGTLGDAPSALLRLLFPLTI